MKKVITITAFILSGLLCVFFILPFVSAFSSLWNPEKTGFVVTETSMALKPVFSAMIYTLKIALGSTAIAVLVGLPAAFFVSHRRFFGKKTLVSLSSVPLCIPPLLIALGFVLAFGMNGSLNRFVKHVFGFTSAPIVFLYSYWGIIIAQGFYNFPLIMKTVADTWSQLPQDEAHSARLLGASENRVFRTVTIFQLLPSLASASILVFLFCFFSFIIV
ncbi:MAG TPA: ABC transporter permease subunit, partial [Treponemataceae bacterium]|nr:ABC transporter permease subunit [Treponemataceae bacterium]